MTNLRFKSILFLLFFICSSYRYAYSKDYLMILKHGDYKQKIYAMYTLGSAGNKKAFWYLVKYLNAKLNNKKIEIKLKQAAAISLGKLKDERAISYLIDQYNKETSPEVKSAILYAFRFFPKDNKIKGIINDALSSNDRQMKWEALVLASIYADNSFKEKILSINSKSNNSFKVISDYILFKITKDRTYIEHLRKSLHNSDPIIRYWASYYLSLAIGTQALDDILKAMEIESVWWVAKEMDNIIYNLSRKKHDEELQEQLGSYRFIVEKDKNNKQNNDKK